MSNDPDLKIVYELLRSLFDYPSYEWESTEMSEKIKLLKSLIEDYELSTIVSGYIFHYKEKGYNAVVQSIIFSLSELLQYSIKEPRTNN